MEEGGFNSQFTVSFGSRGFAAHGSHILGSRPPLIPKFPAAILFRSLSYLKRSQEERRPRPLSLSTPSFLPSSGLRSPQIWRQLHWQQRRFLRIGLTPDHLFHHRRYQLPPLHCHGRRRSQQQQQQQGRRLSVWSSEGERRAPTAEIVVSDE